jgi:DNA-binding MurR/RpiR family transcriptional regulator
MGRTVAPFSQILEAEFESWNKFRRALRREDQEALDGLFAAAKYHVAAMVYASRLTPLEAILMGILVEHQKAITQLTRRIRELEAAIRPPLTLIPREPSA